jgi:hypothetical protein
MVTQALHKPLFSTMAALRFSDVVITIFMVSDGATEVNPLVGMLMKSTMGMMLLLAINMAICVSSAMVVEVSDRKLVVVFLIAAGFPVVFNIGQLVFRYCNFIW